MKPRSGIKIEEFLKEWDKAHKTKRSAILEKFVAENNGKTAPELENYFSNFPSLFFARLTSWLRLTYMEGTHLLLQLQSISVFVNSVSGQTFVKEFLQCGGIQTYLEILGVTKADELCKLNVLKVLNGIVGYGRSHKEFICKCHDLSNFIDESIYIAICQCNIYYRFSFGRDVTTGVRAVAECIGKATSLEIMEESQRLLQNLLLGNPEYQQQIYNTLVSLLKSSSPSVQYTTLKSIQLVQPIIGDASPSIVEPLLLLLRSLHVDVQHEASKFIKQLAKSNVGESILQSLIELLKPNEINSRQKEQQEYLTTPLPVFIQQCAATKLIGSLLKSDADIAQAVLKLNVVHHLLYVMGNDQYVNSQCHASETLEYLMRTYPTVDNVVKTALGVEFYQKFLENPSSFCLDLTPIEIIMLKDNHVTAMERD